MHKILIGILVAGIGLSGCSWSGSAANPKNWFGGGKASAAPPPEADVNPLIPTGGLKLLKRPEVEDTSVPIAQVSELRIERTLSGAIVRATGVATRQGAYAALLLPDDPDLLVDNGTLHFTFRLRYPEDPTPVGSERTRIVNAAYTLSDKQLREVRSIRVAGARNALESRRR